MRDHPHHGFPVKLDDESQHAVGGGMLRPEIDEHVLAGEVRLREPDGNASGPALRVDAGGREVELDGALAHSECGSLPRSPRSRRSFMSRGSSSYASAIESSSRE